MYGGFSIIYFPFHELFPATFHRLHHFLFEQPAGLLPQGQFPAQFGATDPVFSGRQVIDDVECF